MKRLVIFFFCVLLLDSCKDKDEIPKDILPKEKMQAVLWSLINAGEFFNGFIATKDSIDKVAESSKLYGQVFQFHQITREEFERSYRYYQQRPELVRVMLDSLSKQKNYTVHTPGEMQRKEDSMRRRVVVKDSLELLKTDNPSK
jgi:hypothetical protein